MNRFIVLTWFVTAILTARAAYGADDVSPLEAWRNNVSIAPVLKQDDCHSIHAYFNASCESPDGRLVVLYRSTTASAHEGEICVVERKTGEVKVLASNVVVEDAHRAACQQWMLDGKAVAFHDLRDEQWCIVCVDVESGKERVLARGRQIGWGRAGRVVPLYGPHWNPGKFRDLELLDVTTGEVRTVVTSEQVKDAYPKWIEQTFADNPISIFFPILSPDGSRVFFKLASPAGGGFRSAQGSRRYGWFCYDLKQDQFLTMRPKWGHSAWHPNSRTIINIHSRGLVLIDCGTGAVTSNDKLPRFPGGHPSLSPDGRLFVTDVKLESFGGELRSWGTAVGDFQTGEYEIIHRFNNARGAATWRKSHPHPVFSPDGKRIYYNVSTDQWTRLYVAETLADKSSNTR